MRARITFFVGENGSGKSTLLEALAECCGFNPEGGNRDQHRAESFYNFATYIEEVSPPLGAYGGRSLHRQSHGESFMALFANRFEAGIYILLSFLRVLHDLDHSDHAQSIIATHSPILLSYRGAVLFDLDGTAPRRSPTKTPGITPSPATS